MIYQKFGKNVLTCRPVTLSSIVFDVAIHLERHSVAY
jgi:hypothetical protein